MPQRSWAKQRDRDRMRRHGTEGARDDMPFMAPLLKSRPPRRPPPSKADLRATAAAAVAQYAGPITRGPTIVPISCGSCGHSGTARVPAGAAPTFRCSKCGSLIRPKHEEPS
jgi:hypothetical protein